jgi:hypothetical protein
VRRELALAFARQCAVDLIVAHRHFFSCAFTRGATSTSARLPGLANCIGVASSE